MNRFGSFSTPQATRRPASISRIFGSRAAHRFSALGAPGPKPASRGRVRRRRHFAGQEFRLPRGPGRVRNGGKKRRGVRMAGRAVQSFGRREFAEFSQVHHRHCNTAKSIPFSLSSLYAIRLARSGVSSPKRTYT